MKFCHKRQHQKSSMQPEITYEYDEFQNLSMRASLGGNWLLVTHIPEFKKEKAALRLVKLFTRKSNAAERFQVLLPWAEVA